jgi:hypothetical protein
MSFVFLVSLFICGGCIDQKQIDDLKKETKELKEQVKNIDKLSFSQAVRLDDVEEQRKYIFLDVSSKAYQKLDSDGLIFLISCDDIKPYAGGYKIPLLIGNPYLIIFSGFNLSIEWGKGYDSKKDKYTEWKKSLRNKEESFTNFLFPGQWNKVELIIFPAKEDEIQHLKIGEMKTNDLRFPPPLLFRSPK